MSGAEGNRTERCWQDLILSMLAVNNYPIERLLTIREQLIAAGLLDPNNLAIWGVDGVTARLKTSGYNRGGLTELYADRLVSLGKLFSRERTRWEQTLMSGSDDDVCAVLRGFHWLQ